LEAEPQPDFALRKRQSQKQQSQNKNFSFSSHHPNKKIQGCPEGISIPELHASWCFPLSER
jgi:hypothetical protein